MKFNEYYEIVHIGLSNKIRLKSKKDKQFLPFVFDTIDLSYINEPQVSVVKVTIGGQLKLFDVKERKVLNYTISKWGKDCNSRHITMYLESDNCAVFDVISKKIRILPKEIMETYPNLYCKDNYCLVKVFGGEYSFYHLLRYFTLNVRYSKEEIMKLGCGLHWKDIIKRSPIDFKHLPNSLVQNKKVVETCYNIIKQHLQEKKQEMTKEEYREYSAAIKEAYNARIAAAYHTKNKN